MKISISSYYKKGRDAFIEHGVQVFLGRLFMFLLAKCRMIVSSNQLDSQKWESLRGAQVGKTLYILGNGPSLNLTPLYLLKDEHTFCCNSFHLMYERLSWRPNYYIVTDNLVVQDLADEFPAILSEVGKAFFPYIHPSNTSFYKYLPSSDVIYWLDATHAGFSRSLPKCGINNTVLNAAIQVGAHMGYKKICMLGVDLTYDDQPVRKVNRRDWTSTADDPNHFDDRYFGAGKRFHDPQPLKMLKQFEEAKRFFGADIDLVNCGVGGRLDVYRRQDLAETLGLDDESFLDAFLHEIGIDVHRDVISEFATNDAEDLELCDGALLRKIHDAGKIKEYLKDYEVKGPYRDIFLLSRRKLSGQALA